MSTDLVKLDANLAAELEPLGLENLSQEDIIIANIRIQQKGEEEAANANIGKIYNDVTKEWQKAIKFVVLLPSKMNICFPLPYNKGNKILCKSHDGRRPLPDFLGKEVILSNGKLGEGKGGFEIPELCSKCPLYKSTCMDGYRYLVALEDGSVAIIELKRSGVKPAKGLNNLILKGKRAFEMTSLFNKDPKGSHYIPVFTECNTITPAQRETFLLFKEHAQSGDMSRFDRKDSQNETDDFESPAENSTSDDIPF